MPITENCTVKHRTKPKIKGIVLEIAGGRAYLELTNGVEDDYPLSDLEDVEDIRLAAEKAEADRITEQANKFPRFDEIWNAFREADFQIVIRNLHGGMPFIACGFEGLSNYQKMNFIEIVLGTTYEKLLAAMEDTKRPFKLFLTWHLANPMVIALARARGLSI